MAKGSRQVLTASRYTAVIRKKITPNFLQQTRMAEEITAAKMQAFGIEEQPRDQESISKHEPSETEEVEGNLIYNNAEEEPELHLRTWIAVSSMILLNFIQVFALQGPPVVVCKG